LTFLSRSGEAFSLIKIPLGAKQAANPLALPANQFMEFLASCTIYFIYGMAAVVL
jgi:hypothetical protein